MLHLSITYGYITHAAIADAIAENGIATASYARRRVAPVYSPSA